MITGDRKHIHELGILPTLKARRYLKSSSTNQTLRQFRLLIFNFAFKTYKEMIDWAIENVIEPPLTFILSNQSLIKYVKDISTPVTKLKIYPCYTQAVKRCIKLVSKARFVVANRSAALFLLKPRVFNNISENFNVFKT